MNRTEQATIRRWRRQHTKALLRSLDLTIQLTRQLNERQSRMFEVQFRTDEFNARELHLLANIAAMNTSTAMGNIVEFIMRRATTKVDKMDIWALSASAIMRLLDSATKAGLQTTHDAINKAKAEIDAMSELMKEQTEQSEQSLDEMFPSDTILR